MKSFCITGGSQRDVELVESMLRLAGLNAPKPSVKDASINIGYWHEQVQGILNADRLERSEAGGIGGEEDVFTGGDAFGNSLPGEFPGRLWEQLACDIFMANMDADTWGWADTRSLDVLDYWRDFESRLCFVLVTTSLERMLAEHVMGPGAILDTPELVEKWQARNEALLRFHHRNPTRCQLVDAGGCVRDPDAFVRCFSSRWGVSLRAETGFPIVSGSHSPIAVRLARSLAAPYARATALQRELDATVSHIESELRSADCLADIASEVMEYRRLHQMSAELQQAKADLNESVQARAELERKILVLADDRDRCEVEFSRKLEMIDAEKLQLQQRAEQDLAGLKARFKNVVDEMTIENRRVRDELNESIARSDLVRRNEISVQEKLNKISERFEKSQKDISVLRAQEEKARNELDAIRRDHSQLVVQSKEYMSRIAELAATHEELAKTAGTTKVQLEKKELLLQEQLKLVEEGNRRNIQLKQSQADLQTRLSQMASQLAEANIVKERTDSAEKIRKELAEVKDENALLLGNMHKIQEELENLYKRNVQLQAECSQRAKRWERVFARSKDLYDFDELVLERPLDSNVVQWAIRNLSLGNKDIKIFEFTTCLREGYVGFGIPVVREGDSLFASGVTGADNDHTIDLVPGLSGAYESSDPAFESFAALSPMQWRMVRLLARILQSAQGKTLLKGLPDGLAWQNGLDNTCCYIAQFPDCLRYGGVALRHEQINHDYEHLLIELSELEFDGQIFERFQFRLSSAEVRPGQFGAYPKLEFPEASGSYPMDSWFPELEDDFGPKFELRFALPLDMDMAMLNRLSRHDQRFVSALIARLPSLIRDLESKDAEIYRLWSDWLSMCHDIVRIHSILALRSGGQAAVVEEQSALQILEQPPAPSVEVHHESTKKLIRELADRARKAAGTAPGKPKKASRKARRP